MFYRAATVVGCFLLVALGFQVIPLVSAPVVSTIALCTVGEYSFGVFGYCKNQNCSPIAIGYDLSILDKVSFSLPAQTRQTLSLLLVIHPIAAAFTLILIVATGVLSFHPLDMKLHTFLVIWAILTFCTSLFGFLIDILLFGSKLGWCGWLILVSTIVIAFSCAGYLIMRRETSSRLLMDRNNKLLNEKTNFEYNSPTHTLSATSSDALLKMKPSLESFIDMNLGVPNKNHKFHSNNDIVTATDTATNSSRLLEVIEADNDDLGPASNNNSRLVMPNYNNQYVSFPTRINTPVDNFNFSSQTQANHHMSTLLPAPLVDEFPMPEYGMPNVMSNKKSIISNKASTVYFTASSASDENSEPSQRTGQTPYPVGDHRTSVVLPSEQLSKFAVSRKGSSSTGSSAISRQSSSERKTKVPVVRLDRALNDKSKSSLRSRRLQNQNQNQQHFNPQFDYSQENLKPRFGSFNSSITAKGISGSESDDEKQTESDLGTNIISDVISTGEALEIKLPDRTSTLKMRNFVKGDNDNDAAGYDDTGDHSNNNVAVAEDFGALSPTLPLTPRKTGFLTSISESLRSPDSDIDIKRILNTSRENLNSTNQIPQPLAKKSNTGSSTGTFQFDSDPYASDGYLPRNPERTNVPLSHYLSDQYGSSQSSQINLS